MLDAVSNHAGMFAIFLASLLGGFALGLRFRVLVLVPVISACILAIVIGGMSIRAGAWLIVIAAAVNAVGLQVGYLIGICVAHALRPHGGPLSERLLGPTALSRVDRSGARRSTGSPPSSSDKS